MFLVRLLLQTDPAQMAVLDTLSLIFERESLDDCAQLVSDRLFRGRRVYDMCDGVAIVDPRTIGVLGRLVDVTSPLVGQPDAMRTAVYRILAQVVDRPAMVS